MSGFGKFSIVGEYFGNAIVNVLWYRSADWLPFGGNPFEDILHAVDSVRAHIETAFLNVVPSNYTLLRWEGVGYDDSFHPVTPAQVTRTSGLSGTAGTFETSGAVLCADVKLVCGQQHQINGVGSSQRNRGYIAIGPVAETLVDNYGHLAEAWVLGGLTDFAQLLDDTVADVGGLTSLIPIRIHHKKLGPVLLWRTYSDVIGYQLPRVPGIRRSRLPEA